MTQQKLLMIKK